MVTWGESFDNLSWLHGCGHQTGVGLFGYGLVCPVLCYAINITGTELYDCANCGQCFTDCPLSHCGVAIYTHIIMWTVLLVTVYQWA